MAEKVIGYQLIDETNNLVIEGPDGSKKEEPAMDQTTAFDVLRRTLEKNPHACLKAIDAEFVFDTKEHHVFDNTALKYVTT